MGIEKPIDGAGPLSDFLSRVKSAIAGVMPDSVGQAKGSIDLKVTVDTSDVDRAEIALDRLQAPEVRVAPLTHPSPVPTLLHREDEATPVVNDPTRREPLPQPELPTILRREAPDLPDGAPSAVQVEPAHPSPVPTLLHREDEAAPVVDAPTRREPKGPQQMAEAKWEKLKAFGTRPTFESAASFDALWGDHLGDDSKKELKGWTVAAGRKEGHEFAGATEGMDKAGERMALLVKEIEKFGEKSPQAIKAANEMIRLQEKIEEMSKSARDAADAIGGDQGTLLRAEGERTKQAALEGMPSSAPGDGGGGGGASTPGRAYTPHDLYRMAQNPEGAIKQFAFEGIMKTVQGLGLPKALLAPTITGPGGAMAAFGGGAAGAGAVAGLGLGALAAGVAYGWHLNTKAAQEAVQDAHGKISDMRASRALGNDFDFRGETWDKNRMHALDVDELHTMGLINPRLAFQTAQDLGISADNFAGARPGDQYRGGAPGILRLGQNIQNTALDAGVDGGALSQFVGASMRSGATGRGEEAGNRLLAQIHGELVEAKKIGISSNEKLGVLATLRQQEQAQTGYVSEGSIGITQGLARLLDQTKSPVAMGQQGVTLLSHLHGDQTPEYKAMQIGRMVQDGKLTPFGLEQAKKHLGKEYDSMEKQGFDAISFALSTYDKPGFKDEAALDFIHKNRGRQPSFMLEHQMGGGMGYPRFARLMEVDQNNPDKDAALAELNATPPVKRPKSHVKGGSLDALHEEGFDAMTIEGAASIQGEMLLTTRRMADILETIKVNVSKDQTLKDLALALNDGKTGLAEFLVNDGRTDKVLEGYELIAQWNNENHPGMRLGRWLEDKMKGRH